MCGRYTLFTNYEQLMDRFDVAVAMDEEFYAPSFNIAPSQQVVAIIHDGKSNRMGQLKWGLVPSWSKDEKIGYKMINARAETVDEKPSFRQAFLKRRCLIPMNSFYEWKTTTSGKVPMLIKMKSDELFTVAGLWEMWKAPDGKSIYTCTLLTTEANTLMEDIHHRMPVILNQENEKNWLDSLQDIDELKSMLVPYDASLMEAFPVSSEVNSPKNNHIGLLNSL
ncbi:SOS response-associated peptidase [Bacillus sp. Cr_A10]|uniref:SOS response-associated peptidase n=1 Tax=Bacillus sp. Cr_A10 TaxID=3033993 RepID=UPI0023DB7B43|nr:SOS response-associated peptidase [Bacillus sp. Cr_A10]MDF2067337.1 SOS response-associated peptidase [Bacillus sp. Cr_A10]